MAKENNAEAFDVSTLTDAEIEELDRKFEMLSPEGVREMAMNFGSPPPTYEFLPEMKRDDFYGAEFVYNGITYQYASLCILSWNEKGKEKSITFDTKEAFFNAPVFDGKTIEEIADQIKYYDVMLDPEDYE
jgi:hypothetical protein